MLPADFALRYDAAEQAAVLAHERLHARRGDLWWNALAALIACLFWFHPLAGAAQLCQGLVEVSHDRQPAGRLHHAGHLTHQGAHHASAGPRIPAPRAHIAVAMLLAGFSVAGAGFGWTATGEAASSSAGAGGYRLAMDLRIDGGAPRHDEVLTQGSYRLVGLRDEAGRDCAADLALADGKDATVVVQIKLVCDGKLASNPRMVAKLGETMTIAIGRNEQQADGSQVTVKGFRLSMRVDKAGA